MVLPSDGGPQLLSFLAPLVGRVVTLAVLEAAVSRGVICPATDVAALLLAMDSCGWVAAARASSISAGIESRALWPSLLLQPQEVLFVIRGEAVWPCLASLDVNVPACLSNPAQRS